MKTGLLAIAKASRAEKRYFKRKKHDFTCKTTKNYGFTFKFPKITA